MFANVPHTCLKRASCTPVQAHPQPNPDAAPAQKKSIPPNITQKTKLICRLHIRILKYSP